MNFYKYRLLRVGYVKQDRTLFWPIFSVLDARWSPTVTCSGKEQLCQKSIFADKQLRYKNSRRKQDRNCIMLRTHQQKTWPIDADNVSCHNVTYSIKISPPTSGSDIKEKASATRPSANDIRVQILSASRQLRDNRRNETVTAACFAFAEQEPDRRKRVYLLS